MRYCFTGGEWSFEYVVLIRRSVVSFEPVVSPTQPSTLSASNRYYVAGLLTNGAHPLSSPAFRPRALHEQLLLPF